MQKTIAEETVAAAARQLALAQDPAARRRRRRIRRDPGAGRRLISRRRDAARPRHQQALRAPSRRWPGHPAARGRGAGAARPAARPVPVGMPSVRTARAPAGRGGRGRRVAAAFLPPPRQGPRRPNCRASTLTASDQRDQQRRVRAQAARQPVWSLGGGLVAPLFLGGQLQAQETSAPPSRNRRSPSTAVSGRARSARSRTRWPRSSASTRAEAILKRRRWPRTCVRSNSPTSATSRFGDLRAVQQQQLALAAAPDRSAAGAGQAARAAGQPVPWRSAASTRTPCRDDGRCGGQGMASAQR